MQLPEVEMHMREMVYLNLLREQDAAMLSESAK
jgi:hypothetical protein